MARCSHCTWGNPARSERRSIHRFRPPTQPSAKASASHRTTGGLKYVETWLAHLGAHGSALRRTGIRIRAAYAHSSDKRVSRPTPHLMSIANELSFPNRLRPSDQKWLEPMPPAPVAAPGCCTVKTVCTPSVATPKIRWNGAMILPSAESKAYSLSADR